MVSTDLRYQALKVVKEMPEKNFNREMAINTETLLKFVKKLCDKLREKIA